MSRQAPHSQYDTERPRRRRRVKDPIRAMVNASVAHAMLPPATRPALQALPDSVESVDAIVLSESQTTIRVRLRNGQARYFLVRVTEVMQ